MKNRKNFIQVFEHQKLRYAEDSSFKKNHFETMVLFNEKNHSKFFTIIHKGVQFSNYVGVIQIGRLTIEILPKADNNKNPDKNLWQGVLLKMLRMCKHLNIDNVSETTLKKKYNSILDVYFDMYLNEVEYLIKKGLIKKYRRIQKNQSALKGKLLFNKNIQKNLIHKERVYCEHQIYDKDHLIHQVLFKGLLILDRLLSNHLRDKLNRVLFEFKDFKNISITAKHFDKISSNRKNIDYQKALDIAKMIILNYSPNIIYGNENMLTLLFDMNMLWEEYIYRVLYKHKKDNFSVSYQNKQTFWKNGIRIKTIRPDIIITEKVEKKETTHVVDTKWKIRDSNNPDDEDLKQMFVYNLHWKAEKSLLLFPKINQLDSDFGNYLYLSNEMKVNKCKIGFIDITLGTTIVDSKMIANEIFKKLR